MQSRKSGAIVTVRATRYTEAAAGVGVMPSEADAEGEVGVVADAESEAGRVAEADVDGETPAVCRAADSWVTSTAARATAITATEAASGARTRRQRRPSAGATLVAACCGAFASFSGAPPFIAVKC
jgi:hypothetical protein